MIIIALSQKTESPGGHRTKAGKFKPEYAGKMNFYLSVLNDKVKDKR